MVYLKRTFTLVFNVITSGLMLAIGPQALAVDFAHEVVPILKRHCVACHAGREAKGGFSMNTRELFLDSEAAVPGDAARSYFLELVRSKDPDTQMPPRDKARVSVEEIDVLARWVDANMPWTEGLSFAETTYEPPLLPRQVALPSPDSNSNPIDQILDRYLQEHQLPQPKPINDSTFARRAHLDLVGLLPTDQELTQFLSDPSPDRRETLVQRLLEEDVAYTEHWLTFWNDLLRNDYNGTGFITGGRKQISDWLYRSLMTNKPFDLFTRELISPSDESSRGFIDGIKWRGTVSAGQTIDIQFAQSVAQSFLGINLKCASCHDSFIDRWKLSEAYSLAAVYAPQPLAIHRCDKPTGEVARAGWLFPELGQIDADAPREVRLQQLAALVTHPNNGRYARTIVNRLWAQLMGRGIVHPLDAMNTQPWNEDLLDYLANDFVASGYNLKAILKRIATSRAYGSQAEIISEDPSLEGDYLYSGPRARRLTAEQFVDAVWQLTGTAPTTFDAPVTRGAVDESLLASMELQSQWIWGDSAKDAGRPPAGEELTFKKTIELSHAVKGGAAVVSADNAFDLFLNGRRIATSDDWQIPQVIPLAAHLKKGENTVVIVARNAGSEPNAAGLFFEARLRLEDESLVAIAADDSWQFSTNSPAGREGRLGKLEGPWTTVICLGNPQAYQRIESKLKRGLALGISGEASMVRASLINSDFLMRSLGRPNRDQIVTSRPSDLTTLEAIDLANGQVFADALSKGANSLIQQSLTSHQLASKVFRTALAREPTAEELRAIVEQLGDQPSQQSIEDLLWSVCMMPEFFMVR